MSTQEEMHEAVTLVTDMHSPLHSQEMISLMEMHLIQSTSRGEIQDVQPGELHGRDREVAGNEPYLYKPGDATFATGRDDGPQEQPEGDAQG